MATCSNSTISVPGFRCTSRRLIGFGLALFAFSPISSSAILPNQSPVALSRPGLRPELTTLDLTDEGSLSLTSGWTNTFNRYKDGAVVDAEVRTVEVSTSQPLTDGLSWRASLPMHWIGGGVLDSFIEEWDSAIGVPNRERERNPKDRYLLRTPRTISQDGYFFGGVQTELDYDLSRSETFALTTYSGLRIPLQGGELSQGSLDPFAGVRGSTLVSPITFGFGAQGAIFTDRNIKETRYAPGQFGGYLSATGEITDSLRLFSVVTMNSGLLRGVSEYPDLELYIDLGGDLSVGAGSLQLYLRENPYRTDETTDVSFFLGYTVRLPLL